jgi:hypothetical protein
MIKLMLSRNLCHRASTFEIRATLMGDLNTWITITLDDAHSSAADVKKGVEQEVGIRPAMQELFQYDEGWTGTKSIGGSGHSEEQEEAAFIEDDFVFDNPCAVLVSVNDAYDIVLEGQDEGQAGYNVMGMYERMDGAEVNGRGVWQGLGGMERFLYYAITPALSSGREVVRDVVGDHINMEVTPNEKHSKWLVGSRTGMESGTPHEAQAYISSTSTFPEGQHHRDSGEGSSWLALDSSLGWVPAPKLWVRPISSAKKTAAAERMEQEQAEALVLAQQIPRLEVEGLELDLFDVMGEYELVEGKVMSGRAVWQKKVYDDIAVLPRWLLYYSSSSEWIISDRGCMEKGSAAGIMGVVTAAFTPDKTRASEKWLVTDGENFVKNETMRVRVLQ